MRANGQGDYARGGGELLVGCKAGMCGIDYDRGICTLISSPFSPYCLRHASKVITYLNQSIKERKNDIITRQTTLSNNQRGKYIPQSNIVKLLSHITTHLPLQHCWVLATNFNFDTDLAAHEPNM